MHKRSSSVTYQSNVTKCNVISQNLSFYPNISSNHELSGLRVIVVLCFQVVHQMNVCMTTTKAALSYLLKQFTMALPDRLPVILAPASAMVLAVSLRLSRMAPMRSMWLPLALKLPVRPPTLPSPMLGLCLASATDVVSKYKINQEMKNERRMVTHFPALNSHRISERVSDYIKYKSHSWLSMKRSISGEQQLNLRLVLNLR